LSPSHAVATELQGQLLARERELDSREDAIITWEEGSTAFAHALQEACKEHDASRARADATERDFFTQVQASSSRSKQLTDLSRTFEECKILLCLQEMDQEVREVILVEEQERGLRPTDG
jgi:hypothetical protein